MLLHSVTAYTDPLKSRSRCFESRVEMFTGSVPPQARSIIVIWLQWLRQRCGAHDELGASLRGSSLFFGPRPHDSVTPSKSTANRRYDSDPSHRRADARRTWPQRRTKRARRRAEGVKRARPDNEAEETRQVRVNLHVCLDQQGSRANVVHVHPC